MATSSSRPPLREEILKKTLVDGPNPLFTRLEVVPEIGSTNTRALSLAAQGCADRGIVLADFQTSGRGRLGRKWVAPACSQVSASVILRPGAVNPDVLGWLPAVAGLAVRDALFECGVLGASLKWPNDVLVRGKKIAGVLVEMTTVTAESDFGFRLPALVVGIGLNVSLTRSELPVPTATSMKLEAASVDDRDKVAIALLRAFAQRESQWRACAYGSGARISPTIADEYRQLCSTLGRQVRVEQPAGKTCEGSAIDIDQNGRLIVDVEGQLRTIGVGDVTHVRPSSGDW